MKNKKGIYMVGLLFIMIFMLTGCKSSNTDYDSNKKNIHTDGKKEDKLSIEDLKNESAEDHKEVIPENIPEGTIEDTNKEISENIHDKSINDNNQEISEDIHDKSINDNNQEIIEDIHDKSIKDNDQEISENLNQESLKHSDKENTENVSNQATEERKEERPKDISQETIADKNKDTTKDISDKNSEKAPVDDSVKDSQGKFIVAIDAGHQKKGNYEKEPIGPGAKTTKPKVSTGTQGIATKVPEYKLTLVVAEKIKEELIQRGYEVVMIRESHDVNISNRERAEMANESGADIFIRIHADGSTNPKVEGASTLYPSKDNPYVAYLSEDSYKLSKSIVDHLSQSTGAKNRGAIARDDMSGINWCTIPVSIIEMGYMTNETEDRRMQEEDYQNKLAKGICDGIDEYFES